MATLGWPWYLPEVRRHFINPMNMICSLTHIEVVSTDLLYLRGIVADQPWCKLTDLRPFLYFFPTLFFPISCTSALHLPSSPCLFNLTPLISYFCLPRDKYSPNSCKYFIVSNYWPSDSCCERLLLTMIIASITWKPPASVWSKMVMGDRLSSRCVQETDVIVMWPARDRISLSYPLH